MSINFDTCLTPSIPDNSLPPNRLRVYLRAQFDTLSVYRGSLRDQVGPATRAHQICNDSLNMKNQTTP